MDGGKNIDLREKLTTLLAECGAEVSAVFDQLEECRSALDELQKQQSGHDDEVQTLSRRIEGQDKLIDTLRTEASESHDLTSRIRERDGEISRLNSELASKQELVRALRRDVGGSDELREQLEVRDEEIGRLKTELDAANFELSALRKQVEEISEQSIADSTNDQATVAALKAELEARKTLIRSLRSDAERGKQLEEELEAKREIVAQLEDAINNHVETINGLRRNADMWRRKYQAAKGASTSATSTELPAFTDTDIATMRRLEEAAEGGPDRTVAIDVRKPLAEARRRAADSRK